MGLVFFSRRTVKDVSIARRNQPTTLNAGKYTLSCSNITAVDMGLTLPENGAFIQEVGIASDNGELFLIYNSGGFPVRKMTHKQGWAQFTISIGSALVRDLDIVGIKFKYEPFNDGTYFGVKLIPLPRA